jgi:hypothetical protein
VVAGIPALHGGNRSVAAIPKSRQSSSDRFVDPGEYEKEADYLLNNLSEIPRLVRDQRKTA